MQGRYEVKVLQESHICKYTLVNCLKKKKSFSISEKIQPVQGFGKDQGNQIFFMHGIDSLRWGSIWAEVGKHPRKKVIRMLTYKDYKRNWLLKAHIRRGFLEKMSKNAHHQLAKDEAHREYIGKLNINGWQVAHSYN